MAPSSMQLLLIVCVQLLVAADSWIIEDISSRRRFKYPDVVMGNPATVSRNRNYFDENRIHSMFGTGYHALAQTAGEDKRGRRAESHGRQAETNNRQAETNNRQAVAKRRQAEIKHREAEAKQRQAESNRRQAELKHRQAASKHRQAENLATQAKGKRTSSIVSFVKKRCPAQEEFAVNSGIPCNLSTAEAPMFVYFSFDDAITSWNIRFYRRLFSDERRNPDDCPIRATFFNSHPNTEYRLLKELYDLKHEVASHSVSHRGPSTWWSVNATMRDWYNEIVGQRNNIHRQTAALAGEGGDGGIPSAEIRGMRAPFLAIGGDVQYSMLERNGFLYDSSIPNNNRKPSWPFTLHDPSTMNGPICRGPYCPVQPHNVWEVVMNVYFLNDSGSVTPCSMIDGCRPPDGREGALRFLRSNFRRHYDVRVPFGINMHAAWFAFDGYLDAMMTFIDEILERDDVYIVPIHRLIDWIRSPMTKDEMNQSKFSC